MIVAVFCIYKDRIDVGFSGDPRPQLSVELRDSNSKFALHRCLLSCLDALLVANRSVSVVLVEPPLCSLDRKQLIADLLLESLGVASVGFLQRSVCAVAAMSPSGSGALIDLEEDAVVPVFDYRELTPFIGSLGEFPLDQIVRDTVAKLPIDIRKPVRTLTVDTNASDFATKVWQGASALTVNRRVWPLLTHDKYKQGVRVWDSLYDMK